MWVSGRPMPTVTTAATPTALMIQKIARQPRLSVTTPPSAGDTIGAMTMTIVRYEITRTDWAKP